jgi:hypothetical protein
MPHQALRYSWNDAILLQTMIHGVSQRVKMEFARRIFDILYARPFQIVAEGFSLGKNAVNIRSVGPGRLSSSSFLSAVTTSG